MPASATTAAYLWSKRVGGQSWDVASGVATDPSGNVLVVVTTTSSTLDLGAGVVPCSGKCIVVTKYSASGTLLWSRLSSGDGDNQARGVVSDRNGNVIIVGDTRSASIDFGGGALTGSQGYDIVLAKYSSTGAHLWSRRFVSDGYAEGAAVASDSVGDVYLSGNALGTINLGGGSLPYIGGFDIVLAKFSASGVHIWSKRFGGTEDDWSSSVAVDARDDLILGGSTSSSSIDFGGGPQQSSSTYDIVMAKLSGNGQNLWTKRFTSGRIEFGTIAVDPLGDVLLAGATDGANTDLGGGPLQGGPGFDIILAKYSPSGHHLWSKRFDGQYDDEASAVASDAYGNVIFTGRTDSPSIDLGGGALDSGQPNAGEFPFDLLVAKYSSKGEHLWSKRFGGAEGDYGSGVAADPIGNVVFAGVSESDTIDLGGGPLATKGYQDVIIGKYNRDVTPPKSTLDARQLPILTSDPTNAAPVTGAVDDDVSGVDTVTATFSNVVDVCINGTCIPSRTTVMASLACTPDRLHCTFSIDAPVGPGAYTVAVHAIDFAGNVESPGPTQTVIVL